MIVPCPECADPLDVPPQLAGRPVRCGACGAVFAPPADAPPPAPPPAPRRAAAFALAFATVLLLSPCAGLGVFVVAEWGYPDFAPAADPDGGYFAADFPGPAEPFSRAAGGAVVRGLRFARDFPPERYYVGHVDLPPVAGGAGAAEALAEAAVATTELVPAGLQELARQSGTHDGRPCLDLHFADADSQHVVRCVLVDGAIARRVYVAGWEGPGPRGPEEYRVRRFFHGFRVLKGN